MEETHAITRLVFQLGAILIAAKLGGEVCERYLKMPAVLGELAAGILIGPFALGGWDIPWIGPAFELPPEGTLIPVSEGLWSIAQFGSIVLLFAAGIETDLRQFLRYARPASIVAVGGVVIPFVLGVVLTVAFGYADHLTDVRALFIGAVLTATSIGISVRVLGDLHSLATPEGVTILGAAVLDDVLGILALTIVVGLHGTAAATDAITAITATMTTTTAEITTTTITEITTTTITEVTTDFSASSVGLVALKTLGFWIALTGIGILLAKRVSALFGWFRVSGAGLALALGLALLAAGLAESFGLAMIIGAFSIGLALSGTDLAHALEEPLRGVYAAVVPIFFVVMGMLVDVSSLDSGIWVFGLVITLAAVVGKVAGSGVPALFAGFNSRGAARVGVGMMPRGEVALIMAGVGISHAIIGQDLYGIAIIMTIITTAAAPPILALLFRNNASGLRQAEDGG